MPDEGVVGGPDTSLSLSINGWIDRLCVPVSLPLLRIHLVTATADWLRVTVRENI